jgi:hypothetical protein
MDSDDREMDLDDMDYYTEYVLPKSENPCLKALVELNDLVRDLNLSK